MLVIFDAVLQRHLHSVKPQPRLENSMTTSTGITMKKASLVALALPLAVGVYACSSDGSDGAVAVDAPPTIGANLTKAIAEVTSLPVTHLIYTHAHTDHIGASTVFPNGIPIIAHEETKRLLTRSADPNRRIPTVTFSDTYTL